jgi:hypothetical protein
VGSSRKTTFGSCTSARAIISRCCCPPESASTLAPAFSAKPSRSISPCARGSATAFGTPKYEAWKSRFSSTFSARSGFGRCGTTPMRRRTSTGCAETSTPSTRACPPVGRTRVVRMPMVVVFPAPFGPSIPKNSPRPTRRSSPSSASTPGNAATLARRCPGTFGAG